MRNYALPCDVRPLTEQMKSYLYFIYRSRKIQQAEESLREEMRNEIARKKLGKRSAGPATTEGDCAEQATLNAEAEEEQRKKRLAKERHQEIEFRNSVVNSFNY